jgi:hypothetical protein
MRRFILISLLLCLTATTATFAQGTQKASATTSQQVVKEKTLKKTEKNQQPTQQIRKPELAQQQVKKTDKKTSKKPEFPLDQARARYYKALDLNRKMQNKLDAARGALVKLRDQLVAEKMSVSKKITQTGNELTVEQAAELEKEMNKIDNKYSNKISKAQMDYDNALIELERAQDRTHEAKTEYERLGGH